MHPHFLTVSLSLRWEEKKYEDGVKWKFLEHNGPYFPPDYQPLPDNVHFFYDGQFSGEVERQSLLMTIILNSFGTFQTKVNTFQALHTFCCLVCLISS